MGYAVHGGKDNALSEGTLAISFDSRKGAETPQEIEPVPVGQNRRREPCRDQRLSMQPGGSRRERFPGTSPSAKAQFLSVLGQPRA
jgi:hypothetical protein